VNIWILVLYSNIILYTVPLPSVNGTAAIQAGLVHTYASAPAEAKGYAGKCVLVIGHGNAAWEFASNILGETTYTHVAGRSSSRVRLALETHYPGNVRALHATLLETYNLKSLDGITSAAFDKLEFARAPGGGVAVSVRDSVGCAADAHGRALGRCSFRHAYDIIISCLGWRFDARAFDEDSRPALASNGKHPAVTARFESTNVPGLYFAGTLAHALDYKKSSGGFIRGFRYNARALHRFLEEEEADALATLRDKAQGGEPTVGEDVFLLGDARTASPLAVLGAPPAHWPATRTRSLRALVALLLRRANSGAGLYQMFGKLADVFVFDEPPTPMVDADNGEHGEVAAMELPWDFFDSNADADTTDMSGLAADVRALQTRMPTGARSVATRAREARVDGALSGALREEVPVGAARALAVRVGGPAAKYLVLTLEFGAAPPPGEHDPFALDRADVSLARPDRSHFIHPVVRYFREAECGESQTCLPAAELHIVEDFLAEWRLHRAHVLPLARFVEWVGSSRTLSARPRWPLPAPPPAFLGRVLAQLAGGCDEVTLYFRGAAHNVGGGEGWWLPLSVRAEAALGELRALAVLACDSAPGVPESAAERAWTQSVREKWAAARAGAAHVPEEAPRPPAPEVDPRSAEAADAAFLPLTRAASRGAVLVVDARAGRCRVLAERLGVELGGARVFVPSGEDAARGSAVAVEQRPLTPAQAAAHFSRILGRFNVSVAEGWRG
jgi:hypothetical protein